MERIAATSRCLEHARRTSLVDWASVASAHGLQQTLPTSKGLVRCPPDRASCDIAAVSTPAPVCSRPTGRSGRTCVVAHGDREPWFILRPRRGLLHGQVTGVARRRRAQRAFSREIRRRSGAGATERGAEQRRAALAVCRGPAEQRLTAPTLSWPNGARPRTLPVLQVAGPRPPQPSAIDTCRSIRQPHSPTEHRPPRPRR